MEVGPLAILLVQPTQFCNIDCSYCYLPNRQVKDRMDIGTLRKCFKDLVESNLIRSEFVIAFHSGEPLAVPLSFYEEACKTIESLNSTPFNPIYYIQTNGMLINDEWCRLFKDKDFKVSVSIDGPAFIHDHYRKTKNNRNTHSLTIKGIELLKKWGLDYTTISVITDFTLDYPIEFLNFFLDNKISNISLSIEDTLLNSSSLLSNEENLIRYENFIRELQKHYLSHKDRISIREFDLFEQKLFHKLPKMVRNAQTYPYHIISLGTNGDIFTFSPELHGRASNEYGEFVLGNIHEGSLLSFLETPKFKEIYSDIIKGVVKCKSTCKYFEICGGGVPSSKYYENGTFDSTTTQHCTYRFKSTFDVVSEGVVSSLVD